MERSSFLGEDWNDLIGSEFDKDYMKELSSKLGWLYDNCPNLVVPSKDKIFRVFKETRLDNLKVIVLGQSPYPSGGHANGIAFASDKPYVPPSLEVILHSIDREVQFGIDIRRRCYLDCLNEQDYSLKHWIDQGILLLNCQLTTEKGNPVAHKDKGWEQFVSFVISKIKETKKGLCYLAWGKDAENIMKPLLVKEGDLFDSYFYLPCEHPVVSLYRSRPWNNENCFIKVNKYLEQNNKQKISW